MSSTRRQRLILGLGVSVLAVLGLLAVVLRQRAQVTLTEASERGPDPIALLASDLAATREDLGALGTGFGEKLQALYEELERSAGERDAELGRSVERLGEEIATLASKLEEEARVLARVQADVERIREQEVALPRAAALPGDSSGDSSDPVLPSPSATTNAVEPEPAVAAPSSTPEPSRSAEPAASPAVAAAAPKKSFLAFQLPSQSFAFDERQSFSVLPQLSRVGFDAKSTLHDFSGVTSAVEGEFEVCLARPAERCRGRITARAASLDTGLSERDAKMREVLAVDAHPEIVFDWSAFAAERVDVGAQSVSGTATGKMTIHGTTREIAMPVKVAVDASKRVSIEGEVELKLSDYGVVAPRQLGLISMEDQVTVWIALRARSLGAPREGATR